MLGMFCCRFYRDDAGIGLQPADLDGELPHAQLPAGGGDTDLAGAQV